MTDASDRRAKELVRSKELPPRVVLGSRTIERVCSRFSRRPAGNSARLWKKFGVDDPFAVPAEFARPEHRTVYAAGRFVRLKAGKDPAEAIREAAAKAPPPKPAANQPKPPAPPAKPNPQRPQPKQTHNPAFGPRAPSPLAKGGGGPAVDRTPPIVGTETQGMISPAGRFRTVPPTTSRRPVVGGEPPGGHAPRAPDPDITRRALFESRPAPDSEPKAAPQPQRPPVARPAERAATPVPPKAAAPAPKPAAPAQKPTPQPAPEAPSQPPADKPRSADANLKSLRTGAELAMAPEFKPPPGAINTPGAPQVVPLRKPTRVVDDPPPESASAKADAPVNRAPPKPAGGGGLDDLFGGGAQEGRVRIAPRRKPDEPTG